MISWIKKKLAQRKHDRVANEYYRAACAIGDAISYAHMGAVSTEVGGKRYELKDPELFHVLDELEVAYAELGYRVVPLDNWVDYAGWGVDIAPLWLVKREEGERPVFTKLEPKRELPEQSDLLQKVWETGKAHEAFMNEDGETEVRQVEE